MKLVTFSRLTCAILAASTLLGAEVPENEVSEDFLVQEPVTEVILTEEEVTIVAIQAEEEVESKEIAVTESEEQLQEGREPIGQLAEPKEVREAQKQTIRERIIAGFEEYKKSRGRSANPAGTRATAKAAQYPKHPDSLTFVAKTKRVQTGIFSLPSIIVELDDTSLWTVKPYFESDLKTWKNTDQVVITENKGDGYSDDYEFRFINQNTGSSVPTNLKAVPVNPKKIDRIVRIDSAKGHYDMVFLNDGTQFEMSSYDYPITIKWSEGDVVIVGVHSGALRAGNPNLLINTTRLTNARCAYVVY